ncbi:MAG: cation:proton antiporter [Candidatus Woesearchaeota archaeon]
MEAILLLTSIILILLSGLVVMFLASYLRFPVPLMLILLGFLLGYLGIMLPYEILNAFAIVSISLIMIDLAARLRWKEFDSSFQMPLKLSVLLFLVSIAVIGFFCIKLTGMDFELAVVFASLIPASIIIMSHNNRIEHFLLNESLFAAPIAILLPLILGGAFIKQGTPLDFLQEIVVSIGMGIVAGVLLIKIIKKAYHDKLSYLAVACFSVLSYVMAELLDGNGILAVGIVGLILGNMYVRGKPKIYVFSGDITKALHILIFVLFGILGFVFFDSDIFTAGVIIFFVFMLVRWFCIQVIIGKGRFSELEKAIIAFKYPVALPAAATSLVLFSAVFNFSYQGTSLFVLALSIVILSEILSWCVKHFLVRE